jgi:hypothetical protein
MWKTFIENGGGIIKSEFPLSTLAHISNGFSAGSIKQTVDSVLTKYRVHTQKERPLTLPEFIGPLSLCASTMQDQYEDFQKFTEYISDDLARKEK